VGPYLISTTISGVPVYWKVDQNTLELRGTEDVTKTSLFYLVSSEDKFHPSEFTLAYWGDNTNDRKYITNVDNPFSLLRKTAPKIPKFLPVAKQGGWFNTKPPLLKMKAAYKAADSYFGLFTRVETDTPGCLCSKSTLTSVQKWREGDEYYVDCRLGRLVMESVRSSTSSLADTSYAMAVRSQYSTRGSEDGVLFRLLAEPFRHQDERRSHTSQTSQNVRKLRLSTRALFFKYPLAQELGYIGEHEKTLPLARNPEPKEVKQ